MIVGDGPEYRNIKKKITILNLQKKVKMFGFLEEKKLENLWSKTDANYAIKSRRFWTVYIEAMSRGIPIITSKQDAGHEINLHGKTGYSADLNNKKKDELFIYMNKISNNNSKLKRWAKMLKLDGEIIFL